MNSICAMYFSATGTTKKVVEAIAGRMGEGMDLPFYPFDFTAKEVRKTPKEFTAEDVVIFGMPVIAGRIPNLMLEYLNTVKGNGALAVPVVLFGNRDFDDALIELRNILSANGFYPVAAAAFVGEHSFSDTLAQGRPDSEDMEQVYRFADKAADKIRRGGSELKNLVEVRGETPLRRYYQPRDGAGNPIDIRKAKPKTDPALCTDCKLCITVCPMEAIDHDRVEEVPGICIKCCACIKKCPTGAKYFDDPGFLYHKSELEILYARRAEPELFL